jgi:hypothetical protein
MWVDEANEHEPEGSEQWESMGRTVRNSVAVSWHDWEEKQEKKMAKKTLKRVHKS